MRSRLISRAPAASVMPIIRPSTCSGTPEIMNLGGSPRRLGQWARTRSWLPPIPPEATAVHGITDADVADEAPFSRMATAVAAFLKGCDLGGFNAASFDVKMLMHEFTRCGVFFALHECRVVDPFVIYREMEKRDLSSAVRFYCGREHDGAHSAEADVIAALDVLDAQLGRYEIPRTVEELHHHFRGDLVDFDGFLRRDSEGRIVFNKGKHQGKVLAFIADTDASYLRWILGQDFFPDTVHHIQEALRNARPEPEIGYA